uniref:Uncharacterized protein n=1 Tax=Candidatus Kentrum sp. FW TaxID=2126338 RepID=A0A450TX75_9GAMM|nr:MAG: hypothetical protein BECKFW1821C_GA0114237_105517 [Candidatus Kentron sp. FW]
MSLFLAAQPSRHLPDPVQELDGVAGKAYSVGPAPSGVGKIELLADTRSEGVGGISHYPFLEEPVLALPGNLCEIPLGHGAGWFRLRVESRKVEMEQVMVESLDAALGYLGPKLVVKGLRELRRRIDDGICLRENQSEIAGSVPIRYATQKYLALVFAGLNCADHPCR